MNRLEGIVDNFDSVKVLVIGDVMLDKYIYGSADRISPEAPVPIVKVDSVKHVLGGAANVAANIASLGGKAYLCGVIGKDKEGDLFNRIAKEYDIETRLYRSYDVPTILKTRVIANMHQVTRFDVEKKVEFNRHLKKKFFGMITSVLKDVDVVVLSDYNKGMFSDYDICQKLIEEISYVHRKPILVDPKPVNMINFSGVDCVFPNLKEAKEIGSKLLGDLWKDNESLESIAIAINGGYASKYVAITCGADGIYAFKPGACHEGKLLPAKAREVYDVSGAGDTALAAVALSWGSGADLYDACEIANAASGVVVGKVGTATVTGEELKRNLVK